MQLSKDAAALKKKKKIKGSKKSKTSADITGQMQRLFDQHEKTMNH